MAFRRYRIAPPAGESGQAALLLLGVMAALLVGALFLGSWGMALGARGKHQRAADLAAVSAAGAMADAYPRLFEPPLLPDGSHNPRHLSLAAYEQLARQAELHAGRRNGVRLKPADVRFPSSFAPTRVTVVARGHARLRIRARAAGRAGFAYGGAPRPSCPPAAGRPCRAARAAVATAGRSRIGRASRCGAMWLRPSTGWPRRPAATAST